MNYDYIVKQYRSILVKLIDVTVMVYYTCTPRISTENYK